MDNDKYTMIHTLLHDLARAKAAALALRDHSLRDHYGSKAPQNRQKYNDIYKRIELLEYFVDLDC